MDASKVSARDQAPIAGEFEDCVQTLQSLCSAMEANQAHWESRYLLLDDYRSELLAWGKDTGASSRKLDHALYKSPRLREQSLILLESLNKALRSVLDTVQLTATPLLSPTRPDAFSNGYFDISTTLSGEMQDENVSAISIQDLLTEISDFLSRLRALAPTLLDPIPAPPNDSEDIASDDNVDLQQIDSMFPRSSSFLKQRLGRTSWRRRQDLRNIREQLWETLIPRKPHKLAPPGNAQGMMIDTRSSHRPQEVVSRLQRRFESRRIATRRASDSDTASHTGTLFSKPESLTSYTATSNADSVEQSKSAPLAVPKCPVEIVAGNTFQCSYCAQYLTIGEDISAETDWVNHLYGDIEPYVCTVQQCMRPYKTYMTRVEWFQHELDNHRTPRIWYCDQCDDELKSQSSFELHVQQVHDVNMEPEQLSKLASLCQRYSRHTWSGDSCPLCLSPCADAEHFCSHVGSHMEQLALASLHEEPNDEETSQMSPQPLDTPSEYGNKLSYLENFVLDQTKRLEPATPFTPLVEETRVVQRPGMGKRGASYSYLSKARALKGAENDLPSPANNGIGHHGSNLRRTIRTLPPSRHRDFTGRIDDLAKIYRELSRPGRICILSGIGGVGKSALASEFTYRCESEYDYIFWVPAETSMICAEAYSEIALKCVCEDNSSQEQENLVMLSREFLEQTNKRWLLVFDNVESLQDLTRFLPDMQHVHGSILITTQRTNLSSLMNCTQINLGVLSLEESRRLLLNSSQFGSVYRDLNEHPEYNLAGDIAKLAERLPLALSLIAGYVLVSGCSLSDFVELWNERQTNTRTHFQTSGKLATEAEKAMETVWNIGLREVTTDARKLLDILAFLDSDSIQKNLLVAEHKDPSLEMLHASEVSRYKRMINELSRRRLIRVNTRDGEEVLSVHRKLQIKILQDMNRNAAQREFVFGQVFLLVRSRFPTASPIQVPEPEKWASCKMYLPHVLSIRKLYLSSTIKILPSVMLARLFSDGGIDLWERGLTNEGLDLLKTAESVLDELKCDEALLRADIHVIISLLLQSSGLSQIEECAKRITKALTIRNQHYHEVHPQHTRTDEILLFNAYSDYACVLLQYNNYQLAEPIFDRCFEKYKSWGPPESIPYEYAKYYHHMAFCKMYRSKFTEAIDYAKQGLHWVEVATGQSAATYRWKFDLGCVVLQSGNMQWALELHEEVLSARVGLHGKFGFLTLQSQYAVGVVQACLNDYEAAEISMRKVLELANSSQCSFPDAAFARAQFHLSQILEKQGKTQTEAEELKTAARQTLKEIEVNAIGKLENVSEGEHELVLFDHLQPVFDGRFTSLWLLKYLQERSS